MTTNTIALVTGVSSGIGWETARLLAERGARTFGTVRDLRRANPIARVELVAMDVNDEMSVTDAVGSVLGKAGKIDILINNAGYSLAGGLEGTSLTEAQQLFETNFFGVLRVTQAVLPSMRQKWSRPHRKHQFNARCSAGALPRDLRREQTCARGLYGNVGS